MSVASVDSRIWWRSFGFLGSVILVLSLQLALIYWLSDRSEAPARTARPTPVIRLFGTTPAEVLEPKSPASYTWTCTTISELLALKDPTIFALPNPESFSGEAWMPSWGPEYRAFDWNEDPRWLPLQFQPMSTLLAQLRPAKSTETFVISELSRPELNEPGMLRLQFLPGASTLEVFSSEAGIVPEGAVTLTNWAHSDLLTNSVIQVVVNDYGRAISATLLSGSGLKQADDYALNTARSIQYKTLVTEQNESLPGRARWAQLVFHWFTVPLPAGTNSPGAS